MEPVQAAKERLDRLLREEANRLGVSEETLIHDAQGGPLFGAAEARARRAGLDSTAGLLGHDQTRITTSRYPTPSCFEPFEVDLMASGRLDSDRLKHLEECSACRGLVNYVTPPAQGEIEFAREVQKLATEPSEAAREATSSFDWVPWSKDVFATGVPFGAAVAVVGAATSRTPVIAAGLGILGLSIVILIFTTRHARLTHMFAGFWETSGGALMAATACSLLLMPLLSTVWQDNTRLQQDLASKQTDLTTQIAVQRALLEKYSVSLASDATGAWQSEGAYPEQKASIGLVSVSTSVLTKNRAQYRITPVGETRSILADLQEGSGTLYWEDSGANQVSARLFTGKIVSVDSKRVTLVDALKRPHSLALTADTPTLTVNQRIIAITDASAKQLIDATPVATAVARTIEPAQ